MFAGVLALLLAARLASAQTPEPDIGTRLLAEPDVRAALDAARDAEARTLDDQVRLCAVPAPPFAETDRARLLAELLRGSGVEQVRLDRVGNVIGVRPGRAAHPHLVLSAHLDTVFPAGTPVDPVREGDTIRGPGIGDNCRGLAVLVAVARALEAARLSTQGTITFVGTVGEEGLGDLRGVKALFRESLQGQVDAFVAIDGAGVAITNAGVASRRYRVTFRGPGGHSYGAFGVANPVHAVGRTIALLADVEVPRRPRTTFSVGRVGGGTSINAIASEAWMEVDLRSEDPAALGKLVEAFEDQVRRALAAENARWAQAGRLTVELNVVGDRPGGTTARGSPVVVAAEAVTAALDLPVLVREGSTDANLPISLGIPAVTIEGGGSGTGAHTLDETFRTTDAWRGTQRALLLALALVR